MAGFGSGEPVVEIAGMAGFESGEPAVEMVGFDSRSNPSRIYRATASRSSPSSRAICLLDHPRLYNVCIE